MTVHLQNIFAQIPNALSAAGNAMNAARFGLRKEVPFERWFFDHGFDAPLLDSQDQMRARAWALFSALEGSVRATAATLSYLFSFVLEPQEKQRYLDMLKAQTQGLYLSLLAVASPNAAKVKAYNNGNPAIGGSLLNWQWGKLYTGS